jgi:hypothetical protein
LRLLLDEDLSPKNAGILKKSGVDAVSVHDVGRQGLSDREQLEFAASEGRCLVTRNRNDFILLTREFFDRGAAHGGVLVVARSLPPDDFIAIARGVRRYVRRYGDAPTGYLFDYVFSSPKT